MGRPDQQIQLRSWPGAQRDAEMDEDFDDDMARYISEAIDDLVEDHIVHRPLSAGNASMHFNV